MSEIGSLIARYGNLKKAILEAVSEDDPGKIHDLDGELVECWQSIMEHNPGAGAGREQLAEFLLREMSGEFGLTPMQVQIRQKLLAMVQVTR